MSKIEPERLNKEELEYEISIRGASPKGTVKDYCKVLRELLVLESTGHTFEVQQKYEPENEIKICQTKITELEAMLKESLTTTSKRKIATKLAHVLARIQRISTVDSSLTEERSNLLTQSLQLMSDFKSKETLTIESPKIPAELILHQNISTGQNDSATASSTPSKCSQSGTPLKSSQSADTNSDLTTVLKNLHLEQHHNFKSWNLKFSGRNDSRSLNAFLEQIEDTRNARGITEDQLFKGAFEFFEGEALVYYRAVKGQASDWKSLTNLFREEFFRDGNKKVWEQLKSRTQGTTESIAIYIAYMENLFGRLSFTVEEKVKLEIIKERIRPEYQLRLDLIDNIDSLDHLIKLGRKIEDTQRSIKNFTPPSLHKDAVEIDLEYKPLYSLSPDIDRSVKKLDTLQLNKQVTFDEYSDPKNEHRRSSSRNSSRSSRNGSTDRDCSLDRSRSKTRRSQKRSPSKVNYCSEIQSRNESRDRQLTSSHVDEDGSFHNRGRQLNRDSDYNINRDFSGNGHHSRERFDNRFRSNSRNRSYHQSRSNLADNHFRVRMSENSPRSSSKDRNFQSRDHHQRTKNSVERTSHNIVCFKCNGLNHFAKHCTIPTRRCYSCGFMGYTRLDCPNCQGNFH